MAAEDSRETTKTELRLLIAATPENVAVVRQAVAGLADALEVGEEGLGDLKTIATEACMNVAVHAYPEGEEGPVEVCLYPEGRQIVLTVRDWGIGFAPRPLGEEDSLRLGLSLIATLAETVGIRGGPGKGTELTVRIATGERPDVERELAATATKGPDRARFTITSGPVFRHVLHRLIGIYAVRAGLSVDRVSEGVIFGEAISGGEVWEEEVEVSVAETDGSVELLIGPMVRGGGERLLSSLEIPGIGSLRRLADDVSVQANGTSERLQLVIKRTERAAAG